MSNMLWETLSENDAREANIYLKLIAISNPTSIPVIMALTKFMPITFLLGMCASIASSAVQTPTSSSLVGVESPIAVVTNATLLNGTFLKYLTLSSCSLHTQILTVIQQSTPRSLLPAALFWNQCRSHSIFQIHAGDPARLCASMHS